MPCSVNNCKAFFQPKLSKSGYIISKVIPQVLSITSANIANRINRKLLYVSDNASKNGAVFVFSMKRPT